MTTLPDFRLETYFSRWEFTARHHLTASDAQTMTLSELLALADDEDRHAFEHLSLGYTETFGDPADPPVLLVMGLGAQLLAWREGFCTALVDRGHFVVRYDNRDIGLSTHLDGAPRPDFGALLAGDRSSAASDRGQPVCSTTTTRSSKAANPLAASAS